MENQGGADDYADIQGQQQEHGQDQQQQLPAVIDIASLVREGVAAALGGIQQHFDDKIAEQKVETDKALKQVQLLQKRDLQFRFKGNKYQFEFNEEIAGEVDELKKLISDKGGLTSPLEDKIGGISEKLRHRNKLIRIADKSEGGVYKYFYNGYVNVFICHFVFGISQHRY